MHLADLEKQSGSWTFYVLGKGNIFIKFNFIHVSNISNIVGLAFLSRNPKIEALNLVDF